MKAIKNFLFITEGSEDEQTVLEKILNKYGFHTCVNHTFINAEGLKNTELSLKKDNVVIIQGPRNRISDFIKHFNKQQEDIESFFHYAKNHFQAIFLFYDVDHNEPDEINKMHALFNDESSGMLLLSSPCLEVLGDFDLKRQPLFYHHLSEYKHELNTYHNHNNKTNTINYIVDNFEQLVIHYLDKNRNDFNADNIMEHPNLVIPLINRLNDRINKEKCEESYVVYRYFTTVLYVAIAYINGLTRMVDNYQMVRDFFVSMAKKTS